MKNKPLVSIVIPAAPNRFEDLKRCLSSIRNSDYKNTETIVINNSLDLDLPKKIEKLFPKVRVIEMIKNTAIYGFNIGFANAKGDYIMGIDDDCALNKDTVSIAVSVFEKKPKNVMILTALTYNPIYKKFHGKDNTVINRLSFSDGASIYRKEFFRKVGFFYDKFFCWQHSDDLALRTIRCGYKIHYEPTFIINHYDRVNNHLRINRSYYDMRNSAWIMIKNFSPIFFPILILRNLITLVRMPLRQHHPAAFLIGIIGYLHGWLTFYIPLKDRQSLPLKLQRQFLNYYLFQKHPQP